MSSSFYTPEEIKTLGLKSYGENVLISRKCSIFGAGNISVGSNVRIDDFCILSGDITIGNYVHISAYNALYGRFKIKIGDFCGISPRCTLFSASDDFSGQHMSSPMVPDELTQLTSGPIVMHDYCQIGANSIVMPGVEFAEGAVCGAFSFVKNSLQEWTVNGGIPCKYIKPRHRNIQELVKNIQR